MRQGDLIRRILRDCFPEVNSDDPVAYFGEIGDAPQALMYSWLYWPRLLMFHDAVFVSLNADDAEAIPARLSTPLGDSHPGWPDLAWTDCVESFNVFEIAHLFRMSRGSVQLAGEVLYELGEVLVNTWIARLADAYSDRRFTVVLQEPDGSMELRIQVTQIYPKLVVPDGWDARRRAIISR